MKFGMRTPSLKKSIKARTTGKIKRTAKKAINPFYGKKGIGYINDPKKAIYNKIYNKTTFGINDIVKGNLKMNNNLNDNEQTNTDTFSQSKNKVSKHSTSANHTKKSFWKNGKNIAIVILSILLFCFIIAYADSDAYKLSDLTDKITELETKNNELNTKINDNQKQITNLQDANKLLIDEKEKLENEKNELTTKIEELQKTSSTKKSSQTSTAVSSQTQNSSTSSSKSSTQQASSSSKASSSAQQNSSSNSNSQMVWVGNTGNKYHNQGCRTLKGKGRQVTLQQAQSEGREPCKVCH